MIIKKFKNFNLNEKSFYDERIEKLKEVEDELPEEIFKSGDINLSNEKIFEYIKEGDKIYPTIWFLRSIFELDKVVDAAKNGLTVIEKGYIDDPEGKYELGDWKISRQDALWFKEVSMPMNFKYSAGQMIWKINDKKLSDLKDKLKED